jgi:hypothetical protein
MYAKLLGNTRLYTPPISVFQKHPCNIKTAESRQVAA